MYTEKPTEGHTYDRQTYVKKDVHTDRINIDIHKYQKCELKYQYKQTKSLTYTFTFSSSYIIIIIIIIFKNDLQTLPPLGHG